MGLPGTGFTELSALTTTLGEEAPGTHVHTHVHTRAHTYTHTQRASVIAVNT